MAGDHAFHADDVDVAPQRVRELHEAGAIQLIDVREHYEWEAGRIAGARHLELERVAAQADTIDRETPVVFYCRVGGRSAMAANAFRRAGYDAYSMDGGIEAWDAQRAAARARRTATSRTTDARRAARGRRAARAAAPAAAAPALCKLGDFAAPVYVAAAAGRPARLFVVEQAGRVRLIATAPSAAPFLDLTPTSRPTRSAGCSRSRSRPTTRPAGASTST